MKVLRICPEFFSENNIKIDLSDHMRNLSKALKMKGINQTILTEHSDIDEFEGMQILKYKSTWPFSHIRKGLFAFERIKEIKDDFDVIHFHNHGPALISLKKMN